MMGLEFFFIDKSSYLKRNNDFSQKIDMKN